ncbi:MAG: hypothetical protein LBQ55_06990 [Treponema sp.]|nr:hypothetical protein [Treponema sp.]
MDSTLEDHLADALRYGVMTNYSRHPPAAVRRGMAAPKRYSAMDGW